VPPQIHGLLGGYQGWPQWVAWQICYLMTWLASAATFQSFPAVREVFISMSETTDAKKQQGSLHRGTSFQRWSEANTRPPGRFPGRMLRSVSIPQMFPMLTIWCRSIWSSNTKARQKVLEAICYCRNMQKPSESMRIQPLQSFPMGLSQNKHYLPTRWWAFGPVSPSGNLT
jgi:hypothetical protein